MPSTMLSRRSVLSLLTGIAATGLLAACGGTVAVTASTAATTSGSASTAVTSSSPATTASAASTTSAVSSTSASTTATTAATTSASATTASVAAATTAATSSAAPVSAASKASGAAVQISYTTQNTSKPFSDLEAQVVQAFEQQQNVKVNYELFPNEDLQQKLIVLSAANTPADAADIETKWMPGFYAKGLLLDLTSYASRAKIDQTTYYPQEWAKAHIGGKLLILPLDLQPIVLFYNKDVFAAHGVPEPPKTWDDTSWTWDELLARAQKLSNGTMPDRIFGIDLSTDWRDSYPIIWGNGGTVLTPDHTQATFTLAETADSIQYRADLTLKYNVLPNAADLKTIGGFAPSFINGKVALIADNSTEAFYLANSKPDLNYDLAPMPKGKAGSFTRNPSDSIMVTANTKQPDASFALASFITGEYGERELVAKGGLGVPPLRSIAESDDFLKPQQRGVQGRNFQMVLQMLEQGHYHYADVTTVYPQMVNIIQPAYTQVLQGKMTAMQMGQQIDGPINDLLKQVPPEARGFLGD